MAFHLNLCTQIDVEGYEPHVLMSAEQLMKQQRLEHVLTEYSPGQ